MPIGAHNPAIANCLNVPGSTGTNALYYGEAVRVTSTGAPVGGLSNNTLKWVLNNGSTNNNCADNNIVSIQDVPAATSQVGNGATQILTSSQGTGTTTFAFRIWHETRFSWLTLDSTMADNWSPGGSTTRVTRDVIEALTTTEKQYWEQTGLIMPIVLNQTPQALGPPCSDGGQAYYEPFTVGPVIGGTGTGFRADLSFPNEFAAQAWANGGATNWNLAKLFSISVLASPYTTLLDEATGRIPALNNGAPGTGGLWGRHVLFATWRTAALL